MISIDIRFNYELIWRDLPGLIEPLFLHGGTFMSIELLAPEKFSFQDYFCVELALRFQHDPNLRLVVEPLNGEDANLFVEIDQKTRLIEVQVKGGSGAVTLRMLAGCLAHCPPLKEASSLLERLVNDPARQVLIGLSGRCDDSASAFSVEKDWAGSGQASRRIKRATISGLVSAYKELPARVKSRIEAKRRASRKRFVDRTKMPRLVATAQRLFVEEGVSKQELFARCRGRLMADHGIPLDRIPEVLRLLCESVAEAKQTRSDAAPGIKEVLKQFAPDPLRPAHYVLRDIEQDWESELSGSNVLLLSGPPRCGKSDAARYVAGGFQMLGYEIRTGSDIDEAQRYLTSPGEEQRLFLLDDPFGGIRTEVDAARTLSLLRTLVVRLRPTRKLVVAQSQNQLFDVFRAGQLKDCSLGSHKWFDLGAVDSEFLLRVWNAITTEITVSKRIVALMEDALRSKEKIEVGNLRHLASTAGSLPRDATKSTIIRKALEDSVDLGTELVNSHPKMADLLIALAVASAPSRPVAIRDLAFIMADQLAYLPGKIDPDNSVTVFGPRPERLEFPTYVPEPSLPRETLTALAILERPLFVIPGRDGIVSFSHPFYRASAESALLTPTLETAEMMVDMLVRSLFCLTPRTSTSAARNLDWIYDLLANSPKRLRAVEAAIDGLNSIFPSTRDLCLDFLIRRQNEIPAEMAAQLPRWVESALWSSLDRIRWHDGEAWIPTGELSSMESVKWTEVTSDEAKKMLEAINGGELPTSEDCAMLLQFLKRHPKCLSAKAASRLLGYDESVLRADLAKVWLSIPRKDDSKLLGQMFEDTHPRVIRGLYRGALLSWQNFSKRRQETILGLLCRAVRSQTIAATMIPELIVFNRVEYSGDNPPWKVFARLLPLVFDLLPAEVNFDKARLFAATQSAIARVSPPDVAKIAESWVGWLERECVRRLPDDFELAIAEVLVEGTRKRPGARGNLVRRLLTFPQTGPLVCFLKDLIVGWEHLSQGERREVLGLLKSGRKDQRWLHAICVTRTTVPKEIQSVVFGEKEFLSRSAEDLLEEVSPRLLEAAVSMHCKNPGYLWWLSTGTESEPFAAIVERLKMMPAHPLFEVALWKALISPNDDEIRRIVMNAGMDRSWSLFLYLLGHEVRVTGDWLPKTWDALLRLLERAGLREKALKRMAEKAPAILDDFGESFDWLRNEDDRLSLWSLLPNDFLAEQIMMLLEKIEKQGDSTSPSILLLRLAVVQAPPRLHRTYDHIGECLKKLDPDYSVFKDTLASLRKSALDEQFDLESKAREPEKRFEDWIWHIAEP